jgi:hypothetical protein
VNGFPELFKQVYFGGAGINNSDNNDIDQSNNQEIEDVRKGSEAANTNVNYDFN